MKCRLCLLEKELIQAHIIPKAFYNFLYPGGKNDGKTPLRMQNFSGKTTRSWIGVYDKNILCWSCDNRIGVYDDYAQKFFLKSNPKYVDDNQSVIVGADYRKLKLFFLSLLFRISISQESCFKSINFGVQIEDELRRMLIHNDIGGIEDFAFVVARYKNNIKASEEAFDRMLISPAVGVIEDAQYVYIHLPKLYKILIFIGNKCPRYIFPHIAQGENITVGNLGNFVDSGEYKKISGLPHNLDLPKNLSDQRR